MKIKRFLSTYGMVVLLTVMAVNLAVIAAVYVRDEGAALTLPVLGHLPDFALTNQSGDEVSLATLADRIWVADFIFTTCAGPCPAMSLKMAALQRTFRRVPEMRLVSFSVNPAVDTPEVLTAYAQRYGAREETWIFLTGDHQKIQSVAAEGFHLGALDEPIHHSNYFTLVDGQGRLRGYYDSHESGAMDQLVVDIQQLLSLL